MVSCGGDQLFNMYSISGVDIFLYSRKNRPLHTMLCDV